MTMKVRERALVVDDNAAALMAVSSLLQHMGFDVDEATGPQAAMKAIEQKEFDLVVSDINMPGDINGVQLAQILRRRFVDLSIILMTGYNENLGTGEFIVLAKPFEARELSDAIKFRRCKAS